MADPAQRIQELTEEFAFFGDWTERYQYLIDLGKQLPAFPAEKQNAAHKFHGCQSQVWFDAAWQNDKIQLQGTSDAAIVKGLIALLFRVYNGQTAAEILSTPDDFLDTLDLKNHLSANRATGLAGMMQKIHRIAQETN